MDNGQLQKRIAFFVRKGATNFIDDIIAKLRENYDVQCIVINQNDDLNIIDKWMEWADICWFEWCDSLVIYGSKLSIAKEKRIICRLHSYEAFTRYPSQVVWNNVDKLIFVSEGIMTYTLNRFGIDVNKALCIPNGVDIEKWPYQKRQPGYKVAYVGYINYKKGPMLLLQAFKALYQKDKRYCLYIAGQFQDQRDLLYFNQMVKELNLENNYFFEGWQQDLASWLVDKDYIICSSILESQNMSVMQAMATGIKPIIHNFVGAKSIYPKDYIWNTIDEAVDMIINEDYKSSEYRNFIEYNYSLEVQMNKIYKAIDNLPIIKQSPKNFDYQSYWSQRLNARFNIEGVGYIGLGEEHNRLLYRGRIEILEGVLNKAFNNLDNVRVLELGPGIGLFTEYFNNKKIRDYSAIDIVEKSATELSKQFPEYSFKQGDISEMENYEGKYDLIFAASVLLHLTNEKCYEKTIQNISEHLTEDGYAILIDPITVIETKSLSPHVVIRDIDYVKKILESNNLQLAAMFPVSFFMNYPFDLELLDLRGKAALDVFNFLGRIFKSNDFSENEKKLFGSYVFNRERRLLYEQQQGLSEKLLVIRKKANQNSCSFNYDDIFNIESIKTSIVLAKEALKEYKLGSHPLFYNVEGLIDSVEK